MIKKQFLKKLESIKISTPVLKVDQKTVIFILDEKMATRSGILKVSRAEQHGRMRTKIFSSKETYDQKAPQISPFRPNEQTGVRVES